MKELFYELIKETCDGNLIIDDESWNYSFNTIIYDNNKEKLRLENKNNVITLIIKNEERFFNLLEEYLKLEKSLNRKSEHKYDPKFDKWLIANLFANATTEDFINPENFIRRYINYLKDNTFNYADNKIEIDIDNILKDSKLIIKREKNNTMMETPYKIRFGLKNGEDLHELPRIYYGISDGICYIYGIQACKNNDKDSKYSKKINRLLYKINEGVVDSQDYYDYKEGKSDYYPEDNISDVTMSFVLSLNMFITLLQNENIKEIKAVPYLPVRYNSRELAANRLDRDDLRERNKQIQTNLTNKFIRTFRRLEAQNKNIKITLYPYELDDFLTVEVDNNRKEIVNKLLDDASKDIENCKPKIF